MNGVALDERELLSWEDDGGRTVDDQAAVCDLVSSGVTIRDVVIRAANSIGEIQVAEAQPFVGAHKPASVGQVIEILHDDEQHMQRLSVPLEEIGTDGRQLTVAGRELALEGPGMRRLCRRIGAPHEYLNNLPDRLRGELIGHHLSKGFKGAHKGGADVHLTVRGDSLVDVRRDSLHVLSGTDALQAAVDGIGSHATGLIVEGFVRHDERMIVDMVSPQVATEVRAGDVIRGGLRLDHSLVGDYATTVTTFMVRLVCGNGLEHRECVGQRRGPRTRRLDSRHPHARELQMAQIQRLAAGIWTQLEEKLAAVRKLREERVEPLVMIEQFVRRSRLFSRRLIGLLREAWQIEDAEPTAFGVLNALTRVATHDLGLSDRQRRTLALVAGIVANRNTHFCPHCFSVLSTEPQANHESIGTSLVTLGS